MNLEWSAVTLASHAAIVLSIVAAFINAVAVIRLWEPSRTLSDFGALLAPVMFFAAALTIERSYYITARFLQPKGIDLWNAHPSPELLSFAIAATTFWFAASLRISAGGLPGRARRVVAVQGMIVFLVFVGLSRGLW